jgi:hypothetical protein
MATVEEALREAQRRRIQGRPQPRNTQQGTAPQPPIPHGFSQEDIGKPLFYDQREDRLVTEFEAAGRGSRAGRFAGVDQRYVPIYYDPFYDSVTSQRTPIRMRVGMDPTNLDPSLQEEAVQWNEQQSEIRRLAAASEIQHQRNAEWASRSQRRQHEKLAEADLQMKMLDKLNAEIAGFYEEHGTKGPFGSTSLSLRDQREYDGLLQERRDLKEEIASNPTILTYTDTEEVARSLELLSPSARNFGWQLLYGLQRPAIATKGAIGQEEASGHTSVPFASDIAYFLARGATLGLKAFTANLPKIGAQSKELHRELYSAWLRNNDLGELVGKNALEEPIHLGGYAWTWFLSRGAAIWEDINDDDKRLKDSIEQAKASGTAFLEQVSSGQPTMGGNFHLLDDLKLDNYIADLESGRINIGPRQEQELEHARYEQERRATNKDLQVRSEAMFQEIFEALNFADANELDMTDEEYNGIYARAYGQASEALELYTQRSDIPAYWFTYSQRLVDGGDEMWQSYMDAMANFIITAHRMPHPWEWETIANHFTDPAAEFIGEIVFDPINLIPGVVMDEIVDVAKGIAKWTASGVKYGGTIGKKLLPYPAQAGLTHVAKWWGAQSLKSAATTTRFWATEPFKMIGRKVTGFDEIIKAIDDGYRGVVDIRRGLTPRQTMILRKLGQVFGWEDTDEAIQNLQQLFKAGRESAVNQRMEDIYNSAPEMNRIRRLENVPSDTALSQGIVKKHAEAWAEDWANVMPQVGDVFERAYIIEKKLTRTLMDEGFLAYLHKNGLGTTAAESLVKLNQMGMTAWKTAVLTLRPGFTVINYLDSMFRAVKYGADPLRRMDDVMRGVFVKLMPEQILTRFAGPDLPGVGRISDAILAGEVGENLLSLFWAGFKSSDSKLNVLGKIGDGARAMNAGFEFSLSARLWSSEFEKGWNIVEHLSKVRRDALLEQVDEYTGALLKEMWNQAGDESVETILQRFMRGEGRFIVPQRLYDELAELTSVADAKWYWNKVSSDINLLIERGVPEDELAENIGRVIDQRMEEMVSNYEDSMRQLEIVQAGGGRSILEGDPQGHMDVENMFEPTRRHADETTYIEEPPGVPIDQPTGRVGAIIDDVESATGTPVDKFRVQEDAMFMNRLQEELAAEGIEVNLVNSARSRAGEELAQSRARFNERIDGLRQEVADLRQTIDDLAQATGAADPEETARLVDLGKRLDYLEAYDDMMEVLYSGSFRDFALNVHPGPLSGHLPPGLRGARWNQYDLHRAQVFEESTRMFDGTYADVMAGNVDLDNLPNIQDTLRQWGVDMEFDQTGDLIGIRFGRVNQQTGEFVMKGVPITDPDAFYQMERAFRFDPNIHQGGFQDFAQQPFSRQIVQRSFTPPQVTGAWPHPGMQTWWDDLLESGDDMLKQLGLRYRGVLDESGEPVLRNFNALKQHMLQEARIADQMGRTAAAKALRYRHRALVDEYNMAYKMIDPANAPLMPHSGIPDQVPAGMRQWIHVADDGERRLSVIGNLHEELKEDIALRMQGGTWEFAELTPEQGNALTQAAEELALIQQEGIEAINYGGTFMDYDFGEGAVGLVNRVMIDYAHETQRYQPSTLSSYRPAEDNHTT